MNTREDTPTWKTWIWVPIALAALIVVPELLAASVGL